MTQKELADRVNIGRVQMSRIENGRVDLRASRILQLAIALSKPLAYFMDPTSDEAKKELTEEELIELHKTLRNVLGDDQ